MPRARPATNTATEISVLLVWFVCIVCVCFCHGRFVDGLVPGGVFVWLQVGGKCYALNGKSGRVFGRTDKPLGQGRPRSYALALRQLTALRRPHEAWGRNEGSFGNLPDFVVEIAGSWLRSAPHSS